jgi:hypothetical protein
MGVISCLVADRLFSPPHHSQADRRRANSIDGSVACAVNPSVSAMATFAFNLRPTAVGKPARSANAIFNYAVKRAAMLPMTALRRESRRVGHCRLNRAGSFGTLAAIRRASSRVTLRRCGSYSCPQST